MAGYPTTENRKLAGLGGSMHAPSRRSFGKRGMAQCLVLALAGLIGACLSGCAFTTAGTTNKSIGNLSSSPASLGFGSVNVGSVGKQTVTLTNSGLAAVNVTSATFSNSDFSAPGLTLPMSVAAGQNATVQVQFAPTGAGSISGNVQITSDASDPTVTVSLSGTGTSTSPQLTASPASVTFGNVVIGQSTSTNVTLTNTGTAKLTISSISGPSAPFSASGVSANQTLTPGQTATLSVTFAPTSTGSASGTIQVNSNASNPSLTIGLNGTGTAPPPQLTANPASVAFGNVVTGQSTSTNVTLTNTGTSSLTISSVSGPSAPFSASGVSANQTLTPGQTATLSVTFAPTSTGSASGSIQINSNASNPSLTIGLSGTGLSSTPQMTANPTSVTFGDVVAGQSTSTNVTLTNTGGSSLTISQVNGPGAPYSTSGVATNQTVTAGQSATLTVTFAPTTTGSFTGNVIVTSTAANSPTTISVAGGSHSVSLSWTDNDSGISGYNIYRGTVSGGPYSKINSTLISVKSYTDVVVSSGQTYYYVVTAVNTSGVESAYSNPPASALIPTP
jgi:hypothetical protein